MTDLSANARPRSALRRVLLSLASLVRPLVRHPATNVVLGIGLLVTGLLELVEGAVEDFETVVRALHGVILFGVVTTLRGFLELIEATEVFALSDLEFEGELRAGTSGDEISHRVPDAMTTPQGPSHGGAD